MAAPTTNGLWCFSLESSLGPLAYANDLFGYARQLERDHAAPPYSPLARRRPDIGSLLLDETALTKRVPRLALAIELLEAQVAEIAEPLAQTPETVLAAATAPARLPFDRPWDLAMQVLKYKHQSRWSALRQIDPDYPGFAHDNAASASMRDSLTLCTHLSPSQLRLLMSAPSVAVPASAPVQARWLRLDAADVRQGSGSSSGSSSCRNAPRAGCARSKSQGIRRTTCEGLG